MGAVMILGWRLIAITAAALLPAAVASAELPISKSDRADIVGVYDGGQTEMAVGIELLTDGRFRYGLSYGALDEQAHGTWTLEGSEVRLTSDPVAAPRFVLLGQRDAPSGQLGLKLDVPDGLSRQYFSAELHMPDGSVVDHQLSDRNEPLAFEPGGRPVAVSLLLPVFGIRSESVKLNGLKGSDIYFRFEPNDLGTVDFSGTSLRRDQRDLILVRHGRTIRFRRLTASENAGGTPEK